MAKERSVTWDELREMYPNDDENELKEAAKAEGIEVPDNGVQGQETQEVGESDGKEEKGETQSADTATDAEEDEEEEVDERTKKGLITAKQKERDKRKAAEARAKALEIELENLRKTPVTAAQQPVQQQAPAQQQIQQAPPVDDISVRADTEVRKKMNIAATVDVDDLVWQTENPKEYRQYIKEIAKAELRIEMDRDAQEKEAKQTWQENVKFVQEFQRKPNSNVVLQYAIGEINEMKGSENPIEIATAEVLERALGKVDRGIATQQEIKVLAKFAEQCEQKINPQAPAQKQGASLLSQTGGKPDKLDQLSAGTRTGQLRSGTAQNMTEAELDRLLSDPENLSQIPASVINRYKRGY